jgi:hypothetical protein
MKKLFLIVAVAIFSLGTVNAFAQETTTPATEETAVVEETVVDEVPASDTQLAEAKPMHQVLMQKFLEGGWEWMLPVLLGSFDTALFQRFFDLCDQFLGVDGGKAQVKQTLDGIR